MSTYRVWYTDDTSHARLGHVKAHTASEAAVKAKRFVINSGRIMNVSPLS